jgi:hypothetical protein
VNSESNSKPVEQIVAAIEALDLEPIKFKLMDPDEGQGWSREHVEKMAIAYKRFLTLVVKHPETAVAPSKDIDKFWHGHILDTMKYAEDCAQVFGYFLHHFPYFGMRGAEDAVQQAQADKDMHRLYEQEFGEPMPQSETTSRASAYCMASVQEKNAAYCMASKPAYCMAAKQANDAAYCMASQQPKNAAYCMATAKPATDAAYCMASVKPKNAAYCMASKPSYCMAAKKANDAAYCMAAAKPATDAAYCMASVKPKNAAYCMATAKPATDAAYCMASKSTYCMATKKANDAAYCMTAKQPDVQTRPALAHAA